MIPSLLTALLFAASGICGRRVAVTFGALRANVMRLAGAALLLGLWVFWREPVDFSTRSVHRLFVSGVIGFGLGDVSLFLAYPRIGARLTILVNLCCAPVFGALVDWCLTGARITPPQLLASGVILTGVVLALNARRHMDMAELPGDARRKLWGVIFAIMAGLGQGGGAALSRYAHAAMVEDGTEISGIAQAFVRLLPGLAFSLIVWGLSVKVKRSMPVSLSITKSSWGWLLGAILCGPALGVSCFQWALSLESSVVVLSIIATAPILIMPMAALVDGDRFTWVSVMGAAVAVAGVILLLWLPR